MRRLMILLAVFVMCAAVGFAAAQGPAGKPTPPVAAAAVTKDAMKAEAPKTDAVIVLEVENAMLRLAKMQSDQQAANDAAQAAAMRFQMLKQQIEKDGPLFDALVKSYETPTRKLAQNPTTGKWEFQAKDAPPPANPAK